MSKINLITPPDILYNKNKSILCICFTEFDKKQFQEILGNTEQNVNVYIYEPTNIDEDWLLNLHKMCDLVIVNLDELPVSIRTIMSYLISFDNTYWLTKGEEMLYNKISSNRIFDLNQIKDKIGG